MILVSDAEDIIRHLSPRHYQDDVVEGEAFLLRDCDAGLSVVRPDHYGDDFEGSMIEVRKNLRRKTAASHRFARINAGEARLLFDATDGVPSISVVEDPRPAEYGYPPDPAHALIMGLPNEGTKHLAKICGDMLASIVKQPLTLAVI